MTHNIPPLQPCRKITIKKSIWDFAFSPDGKLLAVSTFDQILIMLDAATGEPAFPRKEFTGLSTASGSIAFAYRSGSWYRHSPFTSQFSANGLTVAWKSWGNVINTWDVESGREMPLLTGHEAPIRAITFSPDGHWLASGSNDKTARIWDMTVLERRHILQGHEGPVISVSFSPDGTRLATGSTDGTVRIWDVAAGTELHRPIIDPLRVKETRAVYHPGGKWLAASEGDKLLLIDTATYSPQLVEPDLGISNIAFSPDGNWLAVDSGDDNYRQGRTTYGNVVSYIRFWHARSNFQKEEAAFARCEKESSGIAFSPDSKVLTAAVGNTIIEWNLADIPLA